MKDSLEKIDTGESHEVQHDQEHRVAFGSGQSQVRVQNGRRTH